MTTIPMRRVISSNISEIGYDAATQTLAISFAHSGTYVFDGVPREIDETFRHLATSGGSVGAFFAAKVRGRFPSTKLPAPEKEAV